MKATAERKVTLTVSAISSVDYSLQCSDCRKAKRGLCRDHAEMKRNRLGTPPFPARRVQPCPAGSRVLLDMDGVTYQYWGSHPAPKWDWYVTSEQTLVQARRRADGSIERWSY